MSDAAVNKFRERFLDLVEEVARENPEADRHIFVVELMAQAAVLALSAVKTMVTAEGSVRVIQIIQSRVKDLTAELRANHGKELN